MNPLEITLALLLAAALGALVMAGYALFLMAAATWEDDKGDDPPAPLPTPTDPPSWFKKISPPPSSTSTSTSAPAGARLAFAPMPIPPDPAMPKPSAAPRTAPPASSATPASSAPPSAAPERLQPVFLDGGPFDGLALKADLARPILRFNSKVHGIHRYIATDRFDLNRRVCIHAGAQEPLS